MNTTIKSAVTGEGNALRIESEVITWRTRALSNARRIDQLQAQRDELLAACKAWEYARNEGGISMVDWFDVAWKKTQAAIAKAEGKGGGR